MSNISPFRIIWALRHRGFGPLGEFKIVMFWTLGIFAAFIALISEVQKLRDLMFRFVYYAFFEFWQFPGFRVLKFLCFGNSRLQEKLMDFLRF